MGRENYQKPIMQIITLRHDGLLMASGDFTGGGTMNGYHDSGGSAWGGGSPSGGSTPGGWTDNGDDAWE